MNLTAENVDKLCVDCLFRVGEDTSLRVVGQGVVRDYGFHPARLAQHRQEIKEMLDCLPDEFHKDKGGGWTFLNACMTKQGQQWGEHRDIEALLALATASGLAKFLFPKEIWPTLPGGMPYFVVGEFPAPAPVKAETPASA